jgi:hypothetical protein
LQSYCKKIIKTSAGVHTLKYSTKYSGPWWNDPDNWNEDNEKYNEYYSNKNFVEYTPEDFEEDTGDEILSDMD